MKTQTPLRQWMLLLAGMLSLAVTATPALAAGYIQRNLASDVPGLADFTDPNLVNPWGIALAPFWICNNRTGTYNVYAVTGAPSTTVTSVPAPPGKTGTGRCTGAFRNNNNAAFQVSPGVNGTWLLDTEDGTITIRSGATNVIKVDNSASGAVYKGLALTNSPDYIYAANFNSGKIEVYDGNWAPATLAGSFADPEVPAGYAPFNIHKLGDKLYVAYALQNAAKTDDLPGPGNGHVAVFDLNGNLLQHLISKGSLNSPWGFAIAPANWGEFSNALLVGNFGDGKINAFNASNGNFLGTLQNAAGAPLVNLGLWALQFGTGGNGGDPNTLYFTAGISAGAGIQNHGLLGSIKAAPAGFGPPAVAEGGIFNNAGYNLSSLNVASGEMVAIFGSNLTDGSSCVAPTCGPVFESNQRLKTTMAGAQVSVNGTLVPIFYATPGQLGVQMPADLTGTSASVVVTVSGADSPTRTVLVDAVSPGIFSFSGDGKGAGAILHAEGSAKDTPVSAESPARPGEIVTIYATGLGRVNPAVATGALPGGASVTATPVTVRIDGISVTPEFAGLAGCCVGLNQVNVRIPANIRSANDIPVELSVGGKQSNRITLAATGAAPPPPTSAPNPAPSIASVSPTFVDVGAAAQTVVILGSGFTSASTVTFSGVSKTVTFVSGTQLTVQLTSSDLARAVSYSVVVSNPAPGGGTSNSFGFSVQAPPPPPSNDDY